jgi:hypothetical protein
MKPLKLKLMTMNSKFYRAKGGDWNNKGTSYKKE